ncbi:MAG TPA: hypothetical protein VK053_01745 [Jiangellaceae bacterium]|nr:hypothetical protein [Jiangellaceae bacterium]
MSPLFGRRSRPSGLAAGERVLATAPTGDGDVMATTYGLHFPALGDAEFLGWEGIEHAAWDRESSTLDVVETVDAGEKPRRRRVELEAPGPFVDVVREQVTGSVIVSREVLVTESYGVRVTARRRASDDAILWTASPDTELDLSEPDVLAAVHEAVEMVRADLG